MGIREQAVLVKLSTHLPSFRVSDKRVTEKVELQENARSKTVNVTKKLFSGVVSNLTEAFTKAKIEHKKYTVPFPLMDGLSLLAIETYEQHRMAMRACSDVIESAKRELCNNRDMLIERDRAMLGDMFDSNDYPTAEQLEEISLEVVYMPVPDNNFAVKIEEQERKKLEDNFHKILESTIEGVRTTTYKQVKDSLNALCRGILEFDGSNDGRKLRENLVENLVELEKQLPGINVLKDEGLEQAAKDLSQVTEHSAETLRSSPSLRTDIRKKAEDIAKRMDGIL